MSAPKPIRTVTRTIVFSDIVKSMRANWGRGHDGYERMIEHHHEAGREAAAEHGGLVNPVEGDAMVAHFESAASAVRYAIDLLDRHKYNDELPDIRVGVVRGDITLDDGRVRGYHLGVAQRVTNHARRSSIAMTDDVRRDAELMEKDDDALALRWSDMGRVTLKGVTVAPVLHRVRKGRPARFVVPRAVRVGVAATLVLAFSSLIGVLAAMPDEMPTEPEIDLPRNTFVPTPEPAPIVLPEPVEFRLTWNADASNARPEVLTPTDTVRIATTVANSAYAYLFHVDPDGTVTRYFGPMVDDPSCRTYDLPVSDRTTLTTWSFAGEAPGGHRVVALFTSEPDDAVCDVYPRALAPEDTTAAFVRTVQAGIGTPVIAYSEFAYEIPR